LDLKGKTALVTGGSDGYGRGIAGALKGQQCHVWITGRDEKKLKDVAEELDVAYVRADITRPQDWDNVLSAVMDAANRIDILVNNAGAGIVIKPLVEQTDDDVRQSIDVNLTGHIYGMMRAARYMIKQRSGIIINISSVCADHAWPGWSVYSAAKSGIEQLAESLHNELREHNVHVTTVTPSWGATGFSAACGLPSMGKEVVEKMMQPGEMGDLIVKVCTTPDHLVIPRVRIQPMVQEINPM